MTGLWDGVLDRSLVGYSVAGYELRRRVGWPADPSPDALEGAVAVVTGGGAGLGKATAAGLAALGARVHLVVRNVAAAQIARDDIRDQVPDADIRVDRCDISSLAEVRSYASEFTGPLHVLIHNAGVMPAQRDESVDGHELTLATHVLGPHLLTRLLTPALRQSGSGRVIWVSSGGMYSQKLNVDDLEYTRGGYRPTTAYARTKRMQVVMAAQWAQRLAPDGATDGVVVHSMHPGWADTPGVAASLPGFRRVTGPVLRNPAQGADTTVWLSAAAEPGQLTGRFWHDRAIRPEHYLPWTREAPGDAERLFGLCDQLTDE